MYTIEGKCGSIHGREKNNFSNIRMKIEAEIVNGICPTCEEYTPLVGLTKQFFRCMNCGSDLEQHVNGKISYIPHISSTTLTSEIEKYFDGKES
jgi:transcription initiation factor IIE alpha subunit